MKYVMCLIVSVVTTVVTANAQSTVSQIEKDLQACLQKGPRESECYNEANAQLEAVTNRNRLLITRYVESDIISDKLQAFAKSYDVLMHSKNDLIEFYPKFNEAKYSHAFFFAYAQFVEQYKIQIEKDGK